MEFRLISLFVVLVVTGCPEEKAKIDETMIVDIACIRDSDCAPLGMQCDCRDLIDSGPAKCTTTSSHGRKGICVKMMDLFDSATAAEMRGLSP
jgi:hypothetical protein